MTSVQSYLDELDQLLLDQPDDCMLISTLDGFLTGIAVSPELIHPSIWLRHVWCGEVGNGMPDFDRQTDFQHFLDLIMQHYNAILYSLSHPGSYEPVLEIDNRNDDVLWEMWIDGFARAMALTPDGWGTAADSDDEACLAALSGILTLIDFSRGNTELPPNEESEWVHQAPDLIPIWVEMLHAWRLENDPNRPRSVRRNKVGRNDPCPCGSGKKYKKCCGLN